MQYKALPTVGPPFIPGRTYKALESFQYGGNLYLRIEVADVATGRISALNALSVDFESVLEETGPAVTLD